MEPCGCNLDSWCSGYVFFVIVRVHIALGHVFSDVWKQSPRCTNIYIYKYMQYVFIRPVLHAHISNLKCMILSSTIMIQSSLYIQYKSLQLTIYTHTIRTICNGSHPTSPFSTLRRWLNVGPAAGGQGVGHESSDGSPIMVSRKTPVILGTKTLIHNWTKTGCLGSIGKYTKQLYGDYNKQLQGSLLNNQYYGK